MAARNAMAPCRHTPLLTSRDLPVSIPPLLPFRLKRTGAAPVTCEAYSVTCIPGTSPARGAVERLPAGHCINPMEYCEPNLRASDEENWLPPQLGASRSIDRRQLRECTCPCISLLPNKGRFAAPLTQCAEGTSYQLMQCSRQPLAPLRSPAAASGVDVLLVVSDNTGHGLFASVERVINQVLFAQAKGLEPYVFLGAPAWRSVQRRLKTSQGWAHGWTRPFERRFASLSTEFRFRRVCRALLLRARGAAVLRRAPGR